MEKETKILLMVKDPKMRIKVGMGEHLQTKPYVLSRGPGKSVLQRNQVQILTFTFLRE